MRISIEKASEVIFYAVLGSLLVDVGGALGLKYAISAALLIWALFLVVRLGVRRDLGIEFGLILYFTFSACYSLYRGVEVSQIYSQLSFVAYIPVLIVVLNISGKAATDIFRRAIVIGSVIIISTFLSILIFPFSAVAWHYLGDNYRLGFLGIQILGELQVPNVYYRWSMWLIPAFIISVGSKHRAPTLLIGFAALITLSTSVIGFIVLGTGLLAILSYNRSSYTAKRLVYFALMTSAVLLLAELNYSFVDLIYRDVVSKFSADSYSTSIKLGHIEGVITSLQDSILDSFLGMGVGSEFYSPGIDDYTINIEVSHFNFVRQFGLIGATVFFGYVLYVVVTAYMTDALGKRWSIGLLMLFGAAGTNPLLMSPVFMVVLVTVRAYVADFSDERAYGR